MGSQALAQRDISGRLELVYVIAATIADGHDALIVGPPGFGKTVVATRAGESLTVTGTTVRRITGSPAIAPVPLAAIAGLIGGSIGGDLVGAARATLRADATNVHQPTVLIVDDAHALDEASAVVIHQLSTSGDVRLIITVRAGANRPPSIDRLIDAPSTVRYDLQPIDRTEAHDLLGELLGGQIESSAVAQLIEWSEGNPLYLRELVRGSLKAGVLSRHGNVWRLVDRVRPSAHLRELIAARFTPLQPAALDALELLAIAGRLELGFAANLVTEEILESLEHADLVVVHADGTRLFVDVAQAIVRDLLGESIGALRRLRIFRTLAQHATSFTGSDATDLQSMIWHLRGGVAADPAQLLRAARIAMQANDAPLGAELARAAAQLTDDVEPVLIGCWCLSQLGRHDEAIAAAEAALVTATDPWAKAVLHQRIAEELWWFRQDLARAEWHVGVGVGLPPGPWNDLLQAQRGVFAILDGRVSDALELCAPLSAHAQPGVRFVAALGHALALSHTDSADTAIALSGVMFAEASAAPSHERLTCDPGIHLISQLIGLIYAGRYDEAAAAGEFVHGVALSLPGPQPRGWAATVRGFAMLFSGQPADAVQWFTEAEADWVDAGLSGLARWVTSGLALAQVQLAAFDDAELSLARLDAYDASGFRLYAPIESLARTWLALGRDSLRVAAEHADEAIDAAMVGGATALLALVTHDLARLNLRLPAKRGLGEFADTYGPVISARLDLTHALLDDDPDGLVAAADVWEQLGAPLFAAEALSAASAVYRRLGRARDRTACDGRAGMLQSRCGPVVTPLLQGRSSAGPLSARESQIAELAGSGLSSREIANRLVIGERTVESHLYRIFVKLGVSSRDELPAALARCV